MEEEYPLIGKYFRHVKRGSVYQVIQRGSFQSSLYGFLDHEEVVVYQNMMSNEIYVRTTKEFMDGRFEEVKV